MSLLFAYVEVPKTFYKPVMSKLNELQTSKSVYYMAKVSNFAHTLRKYNLGHLSFGHPGWAQWGSAGFLCKKDIDRLPRHMRRGGEYGQDAKLKSSDVQFKNLCKVHNIEFMVVA